MSKRKIIHVIGGGELGGAEYHILDLSQLMDKSQFEVTVICFYNSAFAKELRDRDIRVMVIDQYHRFDPRLVHSLRKTFQEEKPDIIHSHGVKANFACRLAARAFPHIPLVTTVHSNLRFDYPNPLSYFFASRLEFWTRKFNHHFIVVTDALKSILVNEGVAPERVTRVYNGISIEKLQVNETMEEVRKDLGLPLDVFLVGNVSRFVPVKGLPDLIEALGLLSASYPQVHWLAVGDGPERETLQRLVEEKNLTHRVHFLGYRRDVARCLTAMNAYISASYSEGLPLSVLEAMALRKPVISTLVGGLAEFLKDKQNGLAVDTHHPGQIAEAIIQLINNKELKDQITENAYLTVCEQFTLQQMVKRTEQIYEQLIRQDITK